MPSERESIATFINSIPGFTQSHEYGLLSEEGTTRAALAHLGDYLERMLIFDRMREQPKFDFRTVAIALDEVLQRHEAVNAIETMFIEDYLFPDDPLADVLIPLLRADSREMVSRYVDYILRLGR